MEQQKRKISVRKVLQVLLTLVVTVGCVIAISSASHKEIIKTLTGLDIHIKNDKHKFVDAQLVRKDILANYPDVIHMPVNKVNIDVIEQKLKKNPWVANAQVYIDNKRMMHVNITQRVPVARIFEESGASYYIDGTMSIMPVSDRYVYYTTVVTGVPPIQNNKISDSANKSLMSQITYLVKKIERDSFWSAQVSQINMTTDRSFEIVPVLGDQRIVLGDTSRLDEKLENLFTFYKRVLSRVGWDKYEVLDLRYKGQVVASPALEWKMPAGAINELQWVETIKSKSAYNSNTFTVDSNGVVTKTAAPIVAVASAPSQQTLIVKDAPKTKPAAQPQAKSADVRKPALKAVTKSVAKIGPPEPPKDNPKVAKPAIKAVKKAVLKMGPPEDKATAKNAKPAKKETGRKTVEKKKQVAKVSAKKEKPKTTVSAAKKVTKKPPVKKEDKKKTTSNKQSPAKKPEEKKAAKYIYNNNH
jgi:cell division protein FtsQ